MHWNVRWYLIIRTSATLLKLLEIFKIFYFRIYWIFWRETNDIGMPEDAAPAFHKTRHCTVVTTIYRIFKANNKRSTFFSPGVIFYMRTYFLFSKINPMLFNHMCLVSKWVFFHLGDYSRSRSNKGSDVT